MNVTPKFVNPAKDGKKWGSIVLTDDTKLMVKADMVGRFVKGQSYEVETESQTWGDKPVVTVKAIKANGAAPSGSGGGIAHWWMPFVSNVTAHAIQAGKIENPGQIKAWAFAAKQAAESIAKDSGFDDMDDGPDFT